MDGTVLDSSHMWETVESSVLLELGYTPKASLRQDCFSLGALDTAPFLKSDYHMTQSIDEINDHINQKITRYYFTQAALKPGALELLRTFKANGIKLALATATAKRYACAALELTGALALFDAVITCSEIGHTKQEPHIFLQAAKTLDTAVETTWVFEDALYAIHTAKAAGFPTCAVADHAAQFQWEQIRLTADYSLASFSQWREVLPFAHQLSI